MTDKPDTPIVLTEAGAAKLAEMLANPSEPTPALVALFREGGDMTEDAWVTAAASVERMRAEIAAIANERDELREKLRVAEAVRDDARAASQRYLDEKRGLRAQLEELQAHHTPGRCLCPKCANRGA